ncbi:MAG: DUF6062 family protein [Oscillospiraceae bacterium]|jgi:hypothetical protein|nr:DUF6062 family protein [Oscillospiraceae bacterium]
MKENICSIPINDILGPKQGCPICRMFYCLEDKHIEHITGAAMMEPLVRVQTNQKGFCRRHLELMNERGNRLSNALVLQTHLQEIAEKFCPDALKGRYNKKEIEKLQNLQKTCYICERIEKDVAHFFETLFKEYEQNEEFRQLFNEQEYICLEHYTVLIENATKARIAKKAKEDFMQNVMRLFGGKLQELQTDIAKFASMFDYRNSGGDFGTSKDSIERSIKFLGGE